MKIEQLIYFVETARQEHIGKASKILGISPSAISHSIKSLEAELGVKLFVKHGKFIILSDDGRRLLNRSKDLIAGFQNLKQELLNETDEKSFYKIGASHTISSKFVANAWSGLSEQYLNTKIDFVTLRSAEVLEAVLSRKLDIGILFSPQDHPDLQIRKIYEGELYICVGGHHPVLRKRVSERLAEISCFPAVLPKAFQGIDICARHPMFEKFSINPEAKTLTDSYDIAIELIKGSNYWGLIPDILIKMHSADLRPLKPKMGWDACFNISVIWRKRSVTPMFFRDLEKLVRSQLSIKR